jgi:hypothetical protein
MISITLHIITIGFDKARLPASTDGHGLLRTTDPVGYTVCKLSVGDFMLIDTESLDDDSMYNLFGHLVG